MVMIILMLPVFFVEMSILVVANSEVVPVDNSAVVDNLRVSLDGSESLWEIFSRYEDMYFVAEAEAVAQSRNANPSIFPGGALGAFATFAMLLFLLGGLDGR